MNATTARRRLPRAIVALAVVLVVAMAVIATVNARASGRAPRSPTDAPAFATMPPGQPPYPPAPVASEGVDAPPGHDTMFFVLVHRVSAPGGTYPTVTVDCLPTVAGWSAQFADVDRILRPPGRQTLATYGPSMLGWCIFRRGDDQRIVPIMHPPELTNSARPDPAQRTLRAVGREDGTLLSFEPPVRFHMWIHQGKTWEEQGKVNFAVEHVLPHRKTGDRPEWVAAAMQDEKGAPLARVYLLIANTPPAEKLRVPPLKAVGLWPEVIPLPVPLFSAGRTMGVTEATLILCAARTKEKLRVDYSLAYDACVAALPDCSAYRATMCLSKRCRDDYWALRAAGGAPGPFRDVSRRECVRSELGSRLDD